MGLPINPEVTRTYAHSHMSLNNNNYNYNYNCNCCNKRPFLARLPFSVGELSKLTLAVGFMAERVVGGAAQRLRGAPSPPVASPRAADGADGSGRRSTPRRPRGGVLRDDGERALRGSAGVPTVTEQVIGQDLPSQNTVEIPTVPEQVLVQGLVNTVGKPNCT